MCRNGKVCFLTCFGFKVERFSRRTISISEGRRRSQHQDERGFCLSSLFLLLMISMLLLLMLLTLLKSFTLLIFLMFLRICCQHFVDQVYLGMAQEEVILQPLNPNLMIPENTQSREQAKIFI